MSVKICVYAICKNESKFVKKWLDSMQEADSIVVLDTGSEDGTYSLLKSDPRVTKVRRKQITPWRFDVARNESLKLVPKDADVLICTDLDEVFEPGWADKVRAAWKPGVTTRGRYAYAWSHNEVGEPQDVFKYDKMHGRGYHWIYPVHEVLFPDDGTVEVGLDFGQTVYLHHYPDREKDRKFYFDLLGLACEENPDDSHVRLLYAREFLLKDDPERALKEYLGVLEMPDVLTPTKRLVRLSAILHIALLYEGMRDFDNAIKYANAFIQIDPTYRDPYLVLGEIYNGLKMPTMAEAVCEAALQYGRQHLDWVEMATTYLGWPYDVLSVAQGSLGKIDAALANVEKARKHAPSDPRLIRNENIFLKAKVKLLEREVFEAGGSTR